MAGTLSVRSIFGVKGNVSNNVACVDDGVVVYPAGNFLVRYNSATRAQESVPLSDKSLGVTAMTFSASRKLIAVAETSSDPAEGYIITVYNTKLLKRRSVVTGNDIPLAAAGAGAWAGISDAVGFPPSSASSSSAAAGAPRPGIRYISFSSDDSNLVVLTSHTPGSSPACSVAIISLEKGKVVACIDATLFSGVGAPAGVGKPIGASFSPHHADKIVVWGANTLAYYAIEDLALEGGASSSSSPSSTSSTSALPCVLTPIPPSPTLLEWAAPRVACLYTSEGESASGPSSPFASSAAGSEGGGSPDGLSGPPFPAPSPAPLPNFLGTNGRSISSPMLMRQPSLRLNGSPLAGSSGFASSIVSSIAAEQGVVFTAHVWLPQQDHNVAATRKGELCLFTREIFERVLPSSPSDGRAIDVLANTPKGFISAGELGSVRLFEYTNPEEALRASSRASSRRSRSAGGHRISGGGADSGGGLDSNDLMDFGPYPLARALQASVPGLEAEDRIRSISVSPSGAVAALTLAGTQLIQLDVANAHVKDDATAFSPLGPPAHAPPLGFPLAPGAPGDSCAVVSLSAAVRKPLIGTVGADGTVRIWNFIERTAEIVKYYPEGATCIALHPSGMLAVVGFQDRLRLMTVTLDDLRDLRQYPIKGSSEARFSRGGHAFAVAHGNSIMVYNAFTGDYIQTLRGHNGKVASLIWAYNDATLISVAADGAVYEWDMRDGKRSREFMLKGAKFAGVASTKDAATLFTVGDGGLLSKDGTCSGGSAPVLREVDFAAGAVVREWALSASAGAIALSNTNPRMLFTGTADERKTGTLRSFSVPVSGAGLEFPGASTGISRMAMSHDDAYLFVGGSDGSVIVYDVKDGSGRGPPPSECPKVHWAEETLLTLADLEERRSAVRELRDAVSELQSNGSYNLRLKDMQFEEASKRAAERAATELEQLRQHAELLGEETADSERDFSESFAKAEAEHRTEMQKRENMYQTKIMDEVEKYQALQSEVTAAGAAWKAKRSSAQERHASALSELTSAYERKLNEVRDRRAGLLKDVEGGRTDWAEMRSQMERDLDDEAMTTRKAYQDRLDAEREQALKFKGENGIMKKKFAALQRDIEENKESVSGALERLEGLRRVIDGLEKEIAVLRSQIHDRDTTIGEKEKRIYELKKKNQGLEKFKFVLDYKIKELKGQVEPREAEIAALRAQIKEVDSELEAYHTSNTQLDNMIGSVRKELDTLQSRATNMRADVNRRIAAIREFSSELYTTVQVAKLPAEYVVGIHALAAKFVPDHLPEGTGDVSVIAESERQREYLQTVATELKTKSQHNSAKFKVENARLVEENLALISQIKSLRETAGSIRNHLKGLEVDKSRALHQDKARSLAAASAARSATAATMSAGGMMSGMGRMSPASSVSSPPAAAGAGRAVPGSSLGGRASPIPLSAMPSEADLFGGALAARPSSMPSAVPHAHSPDSTGRRAGGSQRASPAVSPVAAAAVEEPVEAEAPAAAAAATAVEEVAGAAEAGAEVVAEVVAPSGEGEAVVAAAEEVAAAPAPVVEEQEEKKGEDEVEAVVADAVEAAPEEGGAGDVVVEAPPAPSEE